MAKCYVPTFLLNTRGVIPSSANARRAHMYMYAARATQGQMKSWRLTRKLRTAAATFPACSKVLLIALLEQLDAMTSRRLLVAASEEAVAQELGEALRRQRLHARQTRHALQRARLDVRQRRVAGSRRRRADVDACALLRGLLNLQVSRHSFTRVAQCFQRVYINYNTKLVLNNIHDCRIIMHEYQDTSTVHVWNCTCISTD